MVYGFGFRNRVPSDSREDLYPLRPYISADLGILHYLADVAPVLDANMFIVYGFENGYDIEDLSVKDLTELSTLYASQIKAFVVNKVRARIAKLAARWDNIIKKMQVIVTLPEPMYRQFVSASKNIETIAYRFNNINTEAIVGPLQSIKNNFVINASTYNSLISENIPVDPEAISKFFSFLLDVNRLNIHESMNDISQYNTINRDIISVTAAYLNMLSSSIAYERKFTLWDDPDSIFRTIFAPTLASLPNEIKEVTTKCRALELCHVMCIDTKWIDGIILPKNPIIRDNASSKLAAFMMISNSVDDVVSKMVPARNAAVVARPIGGY